MNGTIEVQNLKKHIGEKVILGGFDLVVPSGSIVALFGPNGCGKTTFMQILSRLVMADSGQSIIHGFNKRKFSYISQQYRETLLPWKTNLENIAFPLVLAGEDQEIIKKKVSEIVELFESPIPMNGYPYQLSGGEQQILVCMRALITRPEVICIDEAFSALDYENGLRLRMHLQTYWMKYHPTILAITHNPEEAVHLAERILVLSKNPMRVIASVDNTLPYPRTIDTIKSELFHKVKDQVLSAFVRVTHV
ncbi:ABC transporter ATP-binding protein [Patescibacteria group bacterium]|nr:MAG: ABC transporter ATP-binding protein [Patescibacteria group bacterium]